MSRILITGATGFVGHYLYQDLLQKGHTIYAAVRSDEKKEFLLDLAPNNSEKILVLGDIDSQTNFAELPEVDVVIHLAARVHVMQEKESDPLTAYREVNVEGTKKLVEAAIKAKVKRFIFISSIHVNGTVSSNHPFTEEDRPKPVTPYGNSKREAEQYLNEIAAKSDLETVIIRPPLVYGPGVRANFLKLLKLVATGLPLPFAGLKARRSMIARANLTDFIVHCMEHPGAKNQTFLISDDNDLSTKELCLMMAKLLNKKLRMIYVPQKLLYLAGMLLGQRKIVNRLCLPLQIDITKAKTVLNWRPPYKVEEALKEVTEWYNSK